MRHDSLDRRGISFPEGPRHPQGVLPELRPHDAEADCFPEAQACAIRSLPRSSDQPRRWRDVSAPSVDAD
eukprot:7236234-Lingulodinium_polyedra.AAC.1